jgi:hypothetical protein
VDYTRNTTRAAIKALTAVIVPAVDTTDNSQAKEQVRLVTDFLNFVEQRVELVGDREEAQLRAAIDLADALDTTGLRTADGLQAARAAAAAKLTDRSGGSSARRRATADLEAATRLVIHEAAETDDERRKQVESAVIDATKKQIAADRAWLLPLGFDPAPQTLQPVAAALGVAED